MATCPVFGVGVISVMIIREMSNISLGHFVCRNDCVKDSIEML